MKWSWSRFFIILTVLILVVAIALMIFAVHSRKRTEEYKFQVEAIFSLAAAANDNTLLKDPDLSVVTSWEGRKWVVSPENYMALVSYLRRDAGMPLFMPRIDPDRCLTVTVCGEAVFRVIPENDSGESILIELETGSQTFRMHAKGGLLWNGLLDYSTEGPLRQRNLTLDIP